MKIIKIDAFIIAMLFMLGIMALSTTAWAEEEGTQDLAKQSQNPT
jgi:hypothetical protein